MTVAIRLATLTVEESRLPLSAPDRAMLVKSLTDILHQYEAGGSNTDRVCLHVINVPALPLTPIRSADCGRGEPHAN